FYRLHVEKKPVNSQDQLAAFFGEFGVSESDFNKLYDSFSVRVKVRQADAMSRAYRLRGVPALVVNGKYLVKTQSGMSYEDMLKVVDFLIEKERTASKVAASA
ncbi:MAG: DsbA family protein, partial [Pseudomonadales bacterium]|nr:DsbA family protein [Pseudomonadales bacterium]